MNWIDAVSLPEECQKCEQQSCYNCDVAGKRWFLSQKDDLLVRRKMLLKSIERSQKQIDEIDKELALMEDL